jgi:hypothetical protein
MLALVGSQKFHANTFDADARAFLNRTSVVDSNIATATNTMFKRWKSGNYWSRTAYMLPIVGGNSFSHSFDAVNPARSQVVWYNGPNHAADGVHFNGVNQYGDTGFNSALGVDPQHKTYLFYSQSNTFASTYPVDMGARNAGFRGDLLSASFGNSASYSASGQMSSSTGTGYSPEYFPSGLFAISRSGSSLKSYKNGVLKDTQTTTDNDNPNFNIFLGALNENGSPAIFSNRTGSFYAVMHGDFTDAEHADMNAIIQDYQRDLGRYIDPPIFNYLSATNNLGTAFGTAYANFWNGLRADGLDSYPQALYPWGGSTIPQAMLNAITPDGQSSSFTAINFNAVYLSDKGVQGHGGSDYINTNFNLYRQTTQDDVSAAIFITTDPGGNSSGVDFGSNGNNPFSQATGFEIGTRYNGGGFDQIILTANNAPSGPSISLSPIGFWHLSRASNNLATLYKDGAVVTTLTDYSVPPQDVNLYVLGRNATFQGTTTRANGFTYIGKSMNATQVAAFSARVHTFLTAIGRI